MSQGSQTIWGLSIAELHDCYWESRGVQVVRPGTKGREFNASPQARIFLLVDETAAVLFSVQRLADWLNWAQPGMLWLRLRRPPSGAGSEGGARPLDAMPERAGLTSNLDLARHWSQVPSGWEGWRSLRARSRAGSHMAMWAWGRGFSTSSNQEGQRMSMALLGSWRWPDSTIKGIREDRPGVWCEGDRLSPTVKIVGPVWIGRHWSLGPQEQIEGPTILWDRQPTEAPGSPGAGNPIKP